MSQQMNLSQDEQQALDHLDRELRAGGESDVAADAGQLCDKYRSLRPSLLLIVKIAGKIPGVGQKIAQAIQFLMSVADAVCPIT